MASGNLKRFESAFAEAALDPGFWSRGLNATNTADFRTIPLALGRIPGALISRWVARSARSGSLVAPSDATFGAIARRFARASMPFDTRPTMPPRRENFRKKL